MNMLVEDARGNQLLEFMRLHEARLPACDPLTHAVVAARNGRGEHLLVFSRRRQWWELPGGAIDAGETPRDCAVRELGEESGVECAATAPQCAGALKILVRARRSVPAPRVEYGALYTLETDGQGTFAPSQEIERICWWNGRADIGVIGAIDRMLIRLAWPADAE
jgi:8-oxo-dGTP diphosphatase